MLFAVFFVAMFWALQPEEKEADERTEGDDAGLELLDAVPEIGVHKVVTQAWGK